MKEIEIESANILRVAVDSTGFMGGDSGHGGKTVIEIEDLGSTDITFRFIGKYADVVYKEDSYEIDRKAQHRGGIRIELRGDTELDTMIEALDFILGELRKKVS